MPWTSQRRSSGQDRKREALGRTSLKGQERDIRSYFETVSKTTTNAEEMSERRGGAHMGFSERVDLLFHNRQPPC